MGSLFEVHASDRAFYERNLREFLPMNIIDFHTHVWLNDFIAGQPAERPIGWPELVARDNSLEDLMETYRLLFPDKSVMPLMFSQPDERIDVEAGNAYVLDSAKKCNAPALLLCKPQWSAEELGRKIIAGGFVGVKVYLSFAPAYIPADEIRIFDFVTPSQLRVLNSLGAILLLHIPRPGRLGDPVNLAQMVQIEKQYPDIRLVIAHVGRAYSLDDAGNAFSVLSATRRICFDISANTNQEIFERLIRAVGPKRILFGSDLPTLRMRCRRVVENGDYLNLIPRGLYGDVSGERHMREVNGLQAESITFFLYEEMEAFRRAAVSCGLSGEDVERVFHGNAHDMIDDVRRRLDCLN